MPKNNSIQRMYICSKIQKSDWWDFDSPPDNEHNFSASYLHEEPIVDPQTIEEKLRSMNLHRVKKK